MAVIAEGGPAGRGLADYMKWRNRRKMLKNIGEFRPSMDSPAIPLPTVDSDAVSVQTGGYPEQIRGRRGKGLQRAPMPRVSGAMPGTIPKDVMRSPREVPSNPFSWYHGNEGWFTQRPITDKLKKWIAPDVMNKLRDSQENLRGYRNPHGNVIRRETGAAATPQELNTFMGIPNGMKVSGDTAEWNPGENIYPRFMVDQLLDRGVITLDDIFDMGAADGDSWKIIPKGQGRMDEYRRS